MASPRASRTRYGHMPAGAAGSMSPVMYHRMASESGVGVQDWLGCPEHSRSPSVARKAESWSVDQLVFVKIVILTQNVTED